MGFARAGSNPAVDDLILFSSFPASPALCLVPLALAQDCDICRSLAIPVFKQGSKILLGVIEVVMTIQMVKLKPELESFCKALQVLFHLLCFSYL